MGYVYLSYNFIPRKQNVLTLCSHRVGIYVLCPLIHYWLASVRTHSPPYPTGREGNAHRPTKHELWTPPAWGYVRRASHHRLHGRSRKHIPRPSGQRAPHERYILASRLLVCRKQSIESINPLIVWGLWGGPPRQFIYIENQCRTHELMTCNTYFLFWTVHSYVNTACTSGVLQI